MVDETIMSPQERDAELTRIRAGMSGQDFYLMHRIAVAPDKKRGVLLEHFQWIVAYEKTGHIVFTGSLWDKGGTQAEGLTLFRAGSWEEAEALARTDPFVSSGAVDFQIERWRLGGGRIMLSIDLSDQRVRFT